VVKFLINRPVAVIMSFIAIFILGIISIFIIPVSLLPDIDIPEISVQINRKNISARELENTVVRSIRQQLLQTPHLADINSDTRDGNAIIKLKFDYGTDINLAFIEVNEKIDAIINYLPRDLERPRIIKASASDIPVFYVNLTLRTDSLQTFNPQRFLELSDFAQSVIKKRIEQLDKVALVDVTGVLSPEILITPDESKMKSLNISISDIQQALARNNVNLGNLMVKDGKYQYNIRVSSSLKNIDDIGNVFLKTSQQIIQLKEIAKLTIQPSEPSGLYLSNGVQAINMAIIKQSDARMDELKIEIGQMLEQFSKDYPELAFEISQDQTVLLDVTIGNLIQDLYLGGSLAILLMFLFLRDLKSPLLIAFSVPSSLIISILLLYLFGISINIISLAGLILGVGMMIDNSIIVIDNISQTAERGASLAQACIKGTNEIISPLISSVLTNIAVFVPLIFTGGIAGALFKDQAISVTVGLFSSLLVSFTLIPVLYKLVYFSDKQSRFSSFIKNINFFDVEKHYSSSFDWVFYRRKFFLLCVLIFLLSGMAFYVLLPRQKMPDTREHETNLKIDWNENIHLDENRRRIEEIITLSKSNHNQSNAYIGIKQFLLFSGKESGSTESEIYFNSASAQEVSVLKTIISNYLIKTYPRANFSYEPPQNIFEKIFQSQENFLVARLNMVSRNDLPSTFAIHTMIQKIQKKYPDLQIQSVPVQETIEIVPIAENLLIYSVDQNVLYNQLLTAFSKFELVRINSGSLSLPVVFGYRSSTMETILNQLTIKNQQGVDVPVKELVRIQPSEYYKNIVSGKDGEAVHLKIDANEKNVKSIMYDFTQISKQFQDVECSFSGNYFANSSMVSNMSWIFFISIVLLFFILAAQFESMLQPFIVLIEIPVAVAGGFFMLYIFGNSINIMSLIGIVVMSGIVINDSILKIDTINRLRIEGYSIKDAIHIGGTRRLKPILMTNMTTVLALVPVLFFNDLGSILQKPLALTILGGMTIGTLVSIYFVPIAYYYFYKNRKIHSDKSKIDN